MCNFCHNAICLELYDLMSPVVLGGQQSIVEGGLFQQGGAVGSCSQPCQLYRLINYLASCYRLAALPPLKKRGEHIDRNQSPTCWFPRCPISNNTLWWIPTKIREKNLSNNLALRNNTNKINRSTYRQRISQAKNKTGTILAKMQSVQWRSISGRLTLKRN